MTRFRPLPRWAIVAAGAVLLCGGLLLAFRLSPQRQARQLGEEFLRYVKDGMTITVSRDGAVTVEEGKES